MMPTEAAGLILAWDKLSEGDRVEQYGSSDFLEALKIMGRKHPLKDEVDAAADRVREMLELWSFAAVSRGVFISLDVLADLDLILQRYERMRVLVWENNLGSKLSRASDSQT